MRWLAPSPTPSRRTGLAPRARSLRSAVSPPGRGLPGRLAVVVVKSSKRTFTKPRLGALRALPAKARFQGAEEFGKQRQAGRLRGQIFAKGAPTERTFGPDGVYGALILPPGEVEEALSKHPALREGWKIEGAEIRSFEARGDGAFPSGPHPEELFHGQAANEGVNSSGLRTKSPSGLRRRWQSSHEICWGPRP